MLLTDAHWFVCVDVDVDVDVGAVPLQFNCPAGRFGATSALSSQECSGPCTVGYECPSGSTVSTASICPAGFYCDGGSKQPCPAGRFRFVLCVFRMLAVV